MLKQVCVYICVDVWKPTRQGCNISSSKSMLLLWERDGWIVKSLNWFREQKSAISLTGVTPVVTCDVTKVKNKCCNWVGWQIINAIY